MLIAKPILQIKATPNCVEMKKTLELTNHEIQSTIDSKWQLKMSILISH